MNGYQFVASLVQSLVSLGWPIAIVICLYMFRRRLVELLPRLTVKHKEWEASFRLAEAEKAAKAFPLPPTDQMPPPTPEEINRFEQIAILSPRPAILEYRAQLDQAIREFARSLKINDTRPSGILIRDLREHELIDKRMSAILDDLRAVGNSAAHSPDTELSFAEAQQFRDVAERAITQLQIATGAAGSLVQPAPLPPSRG